MQTCTLLCCYMAFCFYFYIFKPMLTDGTITLKPLSPPDAEGFAALANNPNVSATMRDGFPYPYTLSHARAFIEAQQGSQPPHVFGIHYNGAIIGATGLHPQADVYRFSAELGYWIGQPYWGKGLTTRAVNLMVPYGFNTLQLNRIYADVYSSNPPSVRVLQKCGLIGEGLFKDSVFKQGRFLNACRDAIGR